MKLILGLSLLFLTACSTDLVRYQDNKPRLEPEIFFEGKLCAWGTVRDFGDDVIRRFTAEIDANASSERFTLDEVFIFDDGKTQKRLWQFAKTAQGWQGNAGDVVGTAEAQFIGSMMHLSYELEIEDEGDTLIIAMDDQLHLVDENHLMGKTIMTKFGIQVGEIDLIMQKQGAQNRCDLD